MSSLLQVGCRLCSPSAGRSHAGISMLLVIVSNSSMAAGDKWHGRVGGKILTMSGLAQHCVALNEDDSIPGTRGPM
eukprot:1571027-Pyramimonas_sp.AAC.1